MVRNKVMKAKNHPLPPGDPFVLNGETEGWARLGGGYNSKWHREGQKQGC